MSGSFFIPSLSFPRKRESRKVYLMLDLRLCGDEGWMPAWRGHNGKTPRPLRNLNLPSYGNLWPEDFDMKYP
jgi:hypothetical protein